VAAICVPIARSSSCTSMRVPWKFCEPEVMGAGAKGRAAGCETRAGDPSTCEFVERARGEGPGRGIW
jgi:hypothetical protein